MADPSTAVPRPLDGAASSRTFQLEVSTVAGGCLAAIPDVRASWRLGDVLCRLPQLPPGHRYWLLKDEAVLAPGMAIAEWAQPVDGRACVTAVVVAPKTEEEQLGERLIEAAYVLDVDRVRELLSEGAGTTSFRIRAGDITALQAAVGSPRLLARCGDEDTERDRERRLLAVMGALLSARADVDARGETAVAGAKQVACALHSAVRWYGRLGPVRVLLDARASVDAVATCRGRRLGEDEERCTALHLATQAGNLPLVALLLERGAGVNAVRQTLEGERAPCHARPAVEEEQHLPSEPAGGPRTVRGVTVRETALHMAVARGHRAIAALLVQAGADASIARFRDGQETSLEVLCADNPGMLGVLREETSAAFLAGGDLGPEVEAALAALAARRATLRRRGDAGAPGQEAHVAPGRSGGGGGRRSRT